MLDEAELPFAMEDDTDSRLRYLCTLGFPLIAAILTALLPGLISILVEAVLVSRPLQRLVPPRPPFNKENEISDSVPENCPFCT